MKKIALLLVLALTGCGYQLQSPIAAAPTAIPAADQAALNCAADPAIDQTLVEGNTWNCTLLRETTSADVAVATTEPETVFTGDPYLACPTGSTGVNVDGQPLMFTLDPYGDHRVTGVVCEYEQIGGSIKIPTGMGALVADWQTTCPSGATCEGVWVANSDFEVPNGFLAHIYVYTSLDAAQARFVTFACEYVATQGHSDANIRVPDWASASGSTYDHPGCAQ